MKTLKTALGAMAKRLESSEPRSVSASDGEQVTCTRIAMRRGKKLVALGPFGVLVGSSGEILQ
jgi:hypothetical protein